MDCATCGRAIAAEDINVSADVAFCRTCGVTQAISGFIRPLVPMTTPEGAWYETTLDGFRLGASTRSFIALFLVPFSAAWISGVVGSIFNARFTGAMFDFNRILLELPFLVGSVILVCYCLMTTFGHIEITRHGDLLRIFTGVLSFGWSREYRWSEFTSVREKTPSAGQGNQGISLEGARRATFGLLLNEERRYFMLETLRRELRRAQR